MAFDQERYNEIQKMSVSSLIHTMLVNFDREHLQLAPDGGIEPSSAFMSHQSMEYLWAAERLDVLFDRVMKR